MRLLVRVNESGFRVGEDHHNAKLTDCEVELMRSLHEDGMAYKTLGEKFGISRHAAGRICRYERRGQTVARIKEVHVVDVTIERMNG